MFRFLFFALILIVRCAIAEEQVRDSLTMYVESTLPQSGVLKSTGSFVYVDLSDDFILTLAPLMEEDGFELPPYFEEDLVGAHISVMYSKEIAEYGISTVKECGKEIQFRLKGYKTIKVAGLSGPLEDCNELLIIEVDAPELDEIRSKYGLPEKRYSFHITVGVKWDGTEAA